MLFLIIHVVEAAGDAAFDFFFVDKFKSGVVDRGLLRLPGGSNWS